MRQAQQQQHQQEEASPAAILRTVATQNGWAESFATIGNKNEPPGMIFIVFRVFQRRTAQTPEKYRRAKTAHGMELKKRKRQRVTTQVPLKRHAFPDLYQSQRSLCMSKGVQGFGKSRECSQSRDSVLRSNGSLRKKIDASELKINGGKERAQSYPKPPKL